MKVLPAESICGVQVGSSPSYTLMRDRDHAGTRVRMPPARTYYRGMEFVLFAYEGYSCKALMICHNPDGHLPQMGISIPIPSQVGELASRPSVAREPVSRQQHERRRAPSDRLEIEPSPSWQRAGCQPRPKIHRSFRRLFRLQHPVPSSAAQLHEQREEDTMLKPDNGE
jgi:hypothetical protein